MANPSRRALPATAEAIEAATFLGRGVETEYRIEGCQGLVLTVKRPKIQSGTSSKRWRFHYSIQRNGKQLKDRVNVGTYPKVSLAEAMSKSADLQDRLNAGRNIASTEEKAATLRKLSTSIESGGDDPIRSLVEKLSSEVSQLREEVADLRREVARRTKA